MSNSSGIGGIGSVTGVARVSLPAPDNAAQSGAAQMQPRPADRVGEPTSPPAPTRFPWLSQLSARLEAAAKQRPPFEPAPVLGDNVDKAV